MHGMCGVNFSRRRIPAANDPLPKFGEQFIGLHAAQMVVHACGEQRSRSSLMALAVIATIGKADMPGSLRIHGSRRARP
jgi:hypothetical protein